ncbi:uncharacterized protein LOC117199884 isoform X2 [Orcinus orca]|uniref:uncharacterized protein LOC117199884 isoform X2 n=1 Tax=Orcinus orca TaxID=9733 RepID=UPI00211119B6|nr:uncharacterized protein LOC117199884 isoform X2 [Orcinus orca]
MALPRSQEDAAAGTGVLRELEPQVCGRLQTCEAPANRTATAHGLWKSLSPAAELPAGQRLRETCRPADEDGGPKGVSGMSLLSCGRVSWACPSADTRRQAAFDETRPLSTSSPMGRTLAGLPPQPPCSRVSSRRP